MYIGYDIKNGIEYAKICTSIRDGKDTQKEYVYLGRVLDKERGIYRSRERNVFTYDLERNEYGRPNESFVPAESMGREKLILDFGDAFLLDGFIGKTGLWSAIDAIGYGNPDTLRAMLCYYVLCTAANRHAQDWWEGSYARILYPKANLTSQRISDFLAAIGEERRLRGFFGTYLPWISVAGRGSGDNILIDSTGLPNSIRFPLTAVSNHAGELSEEVRLVYVTQQESGLPIYFRYCPGNVVDVSTLVRTVAELKAHEVNTKFAIFDAGYYDSSNINALYDAKISFVTRLRKNLKLYKTLVAEHLPGIESKENFVGYNDRYAYIDCVECELVPGRRGYAYVGLDIGRKDSESRKLFRKAKADGLSDSDVFDRLSAQGVFILVSSRKIAKDKILPTYYTRQQIEQIFDIGKNYADMLPLRVQNEDTFRGHLLMTFMATVVVKLVQDALKDSGYNPISLFMNMRNQKCKVFDDCIVTQEAFKKANDCYKLFAIDCPASIIL